MKNDIKKLISFKNIFDMQPLQNIGVYLSNQS